jgi:hypothetical protein
MNFKNNGVRSLYYSSRSQLIYVGGEDGSIIVLQFNSPVFLKPVSFQAQKIAAENLLINYDSVKDYNLVRIEEQEQAMSGERELQKQDRLNQIQSIKQRLQ